MLFSSSLLVIPALAAASASAHGLHHESRHAHLHNNNHHNNKRAGSDVVIVTGANGFGDDQVHTRYEISYLAANEPEQWALFIQTMVKYQEAASDNVTSYYSVASVHGVPLQDWDGVPQCSECGGGVGYCPHDSVLFPAWHRTYMALYEQEFLGYALEVANSYPESQREAMVCAASSMRFPYWDWAATPDSGSVLPTILSSPTITIQGANGEETINNPLYTFSLPDPSAMYYSPFIDWNETLRWPNSDASDATSQESECASALTSIRENMQDSIYNLLTTCNEYLYFSNDDAGSTDTACPNSLEGIHNTIHTTSGGPGSTGVSGGHMTYLPLAAFDPIFWLHHANVDRMFTLWQTVNPDSYGATQTAPHSTWTIAAGSEQGPDSPLEPFRKTADTYWTTNDIRDWSSTFKYTYPEFSSSDGSRAAIIAYINMLYGPDATLTASSISEMPDLSLTNSTCGTSASSVVSSLLSASSSTSAASSTSSAVATSSSTGTTSATLQNGAETTSKTAIKSAIQATTVSSLVPKHTASSTDAGIAGSLSSMVGALSTGVPSVINSTLGGGLTTSNGSSYQYICHLLTPRYALNGSYYVYVFDGQPANSDSSNYLTDANLIGAVGVLAGGEMSHSLTTSGAVPLTRHLQNQVKAGKLSSMSQNATVPYLAKNLNWKIVKEGVEVNATGLSGFQASVYSGTSTPAGKDTLPQWSALQPQVQATHGKAGGLQVAPAAAGGSCPAPSSSSNATAPYASGSGSPKAPSVTPYSPASYSTPAPSPTAYTGAANKASVGVAAVLAVVGFAAML